jgi:hypothetical protein
MTITEVRYRLAKPIIAYNLVALVLSVVFYVGAFIDTDDFNTLISLLIPISAIYVGALFQFLGNSLKAVAASPETSTAQMDDRKLSLILWIIRLHFILILAIVVAKILPLINTRQMSLLFTLVEGVFGSFIGYIINSVYNIDSRTR